MIEKAWRGVTRSHIVEVLAEVAQWSAYECGSCHPEDIAHAMADAVRPAAYTIEALVDRGLIGEKP